MLGACLVTLFSHPISLAGQAPSAEHLQLLSAAQALLLVLPLLLVAAGSPISTPLPPRLNDASDAPASGGKIVPSRANPRSIERNETDSHNLSTLVQQNTEMLALLRQLITGNAPLARAGIVPLAPIPTSAHAAGISWEAFCTDEDLDFERPRGFNVMKPATYVYRERIRKQLFAEGVQLDPPDIASANAWRERKKAEGRALASFEHHRRVFEDILLYYGDPVPLTWARSWGTRKSLDKARSEGKLVARNRFLRDGILDVQRSLKSRPWKNELNVAMFRHAVLLCLLAGPRGSEPAGLRLADVRRERQVIDNWFQRKKSSSRDVIIPERWFWKGPANTVEDYVTKTRVRLLAGREDPGTYFVNSDGGSYTEDSWRMFMQNGLRRSLGYPIGPHALRRMCATIRYVHGWSAEEVAEHLDDTEAVVRKSYIDEGYVRKVGRRPAAPGERPAIPQVWQIVKGLHSESDG